MKVLVLCTGNSCRSQMAHGFLQSFSTDVDVFSAGTKPAESINPLAVKVMKEVGIDISDHIPHGVEDDPSDAIGSEEFVLAEFRRVRDEIKTKFEQFYNDNLK